MLREDFRPDSDVDVLMEFEPDHVPGLFGIARMEREMGALFGGHRVDLRTSEDLSRYFRQEVMQSWFQNLKVEVRRLLFDTHTFLWWLSDDSQLGADAKGIIADNQNAVFVSAATGWEIAIKKALGKLEVQNDLDALVEKEGFEHLPITFYHGEQAGALPSHHKDPFDRMLIAQAQAEGLVIVTADQIIPQYGVRVVFSGT